VEYIDKGNPKNLEKHLCRATLSTTNLTLIKQGTNPGLCVDSTATNHLSHGTALCGLVSVSNSRTQVECGRFLCFMRPD
jgi:hypothetical protein